MGGYGSGRVDTTVHAVAYARPELCLCCRRRGAGAAGGGAAGGAAATQGGGGWRALLHVSSRPAAWLWRALRWLQRLVLDSLFMGVPLM